MTVIQLAAATLFPVVLTGIFTFLNNKTRFGSWNSMRRQIIIGLAFGGFAVLSTVYGVAVPGGVVMNVRDSAALCAGLIFGGPAGVIAGTIGAVYRWLCVYWGGGMYTRLACSLATMLAGIFSWMMRRQLFEGKMPGILSGFGIGTTMEVLHMLLLLTTNISDVSYAFSFVQICAFPMILCNGLAVFFSILVVRLTCKEAPVDLKSKHISYDFGFWLLVCVVVAFMTTSGFTQQIVYRVTTEDAALYRSVTLYLVVFMEILIYTALFILVYQMLKKKVIWNLQKVNDGLSRITDGDLDTQIDVRSHAEFSELSDHVNATVGTLKKYIKDAEERIDKELEFARQIQHSALPSVFPPFPNRRDFDIYASMNAAKEVGGDFYDFYMIDNYTLGFLIADVSGKGIPAAMFMMRAKTLIKGLSESGRAADDVFTEANRSLCENNDADMFITAWLGIIDLRTGTLKFVNAGHNPPLISRSGGKFEYLRTKPNFILAGMDITKYHTEEILLQPGDTLYLYTDGVTEATNENEELFGEQRLETLLEKAAGESPEDICRMVKEAAFEFTGSAPQADDITMLSVKFNAFTDKDRITTVPDKESIEIVQAFLEDKFNGADIRPALFSRTQIVTDEIWSNICRYSGASAASLRLSLDESNTLLLIFSDNGTPFDPTAAAEPDTTLSAEERKIGGLGLHMVRNLTASMSYEYTNGKNVLTLGFKL